MASGFGDGARLMRASFELVRRDPALLWFPVISTCCLALTAGFWIFEGAWLYAINGAWFFYVPLVAIGLYSLFVAFVISFVKSIKGLRWLGAAAQVAWSFATIFVVPLIAFEGLDSEGARRRSFQLAKENWRTETGGLGALRAALLLPGLLFYLDAKLLFSGHVHSAGAKALLGFVLVCGFALSAAVSVVRQLFAVELYRSET